MPQTLPLLGYHCSHEQHPPSALLRHAARAAEAGFTAAMCSDHFHPWSERQGQSGFAWSWLGAAMARSSMSFGTVCAPVQRYHPAVIAQAAATLSEMFPDRFWLAIGTGEALNEAITGEGWPDKATRTARLREAVSVMRALWAGETVTVREQVVTESARLYTRPERPPLLVAAALTPETARWAGGWADGLITAAGPRDRMRAVLDAFHEAAGEAKPVFLQRTVSFGPTQQAAEDAALDQWRHCAVDTAALADLPSPAAFDRACAGATRDEVLQIVRASSDIEQHLAWLHEDASLGYERIYVHNVARAFEEAFLDACGSRLVPAFAT
jgi:probable non-F420 flavinoid oxidoreductase